MTSRLRHFHVGSVLKITSVAYRFNSALYTCKIIYMLSILVLKFGLAINDGTRKIEEVPKPHAAELICNVSSLYDRIYF